MARDPLDRQSDSARFFVEALETAGLVSLLVTDELDYDGDFATRISLWPDEADKLADEIRAAAKAVRDV